MKQRSRVNTARRSIERVILVICEGQTEKCYVDALRQLYRLPITIRSRVCGSEISQRTVDAIIANIEKDSVAVGEIFYMYDADVPNVVAKIKALASGRPILTDPCIELWFLLHHATHTARVDSATALTMLKRHWPAYQKGSLSAAQISHLQANCPAACQRAKSLTAGANPSSEMHIFIDRLEKAKKR